MMHGMVSHSIAALALLAPIPLIAAPPPPPAAVVVAFDKDSITPLIVEGLANKETSRAVEANDPVRIASISKFIMALAALRLMDEGKIDLTRDVSDYLGWRVRSPHHPDAPVTLTHLLMHRAGLSDAAGYIIPLGESLQAKLAEPAAWRDTGPPGEATFEYANLGSPLVATALEAASGERYDALLERLVFAPLGVTACVNWTLCDQSVKARAVTLYRHNGEVARDDPADLECPIPVAEGFPCGLNGYIPGSNASVFSPQGGVRIGMVDLAKIGQAMLRVEETGFLSEKALLIWTYAMINTVNGETKGEAAAGFCGYGLGAYIRHIAPPCGDDLFADGQERIGHGGEAYGLRSGLWFDLGGGTGFAYFTTEVPPPSGEVETSASDPREVEILARARAFMGH